MSVIEFLLIGFAVNALVGHLMEAMREPDPDEWETRGDPRSYR